AAASSNDEVVHQYNIEPLTGTRSPKSPANVGGVPVPASIAVTPDGKSAYVSGHTPSAEGESVFQFDINTTTGTLSPKSPASILGMAGGNQGQLAASGDDKS